jgi:cell division initiation protein
MKITPLEIRQKQFERTLRGYDKEEVSAFLSSLSQEWERTQDETKEMRFKLEAAEREVIKLREVENSLYRTLKTAEETGSNMIDQANKAAELHLREANLKAEALMNEAKAKAKDTLEEAESIARQMLEEMEDRLKDLAQTYRDFEANRDNLLSDMRRLANDTIDRVDRAKTNAREFNPDSHLANAKKRIKKVLYPNNDFERPIKKEVVIEKVIEEQEIEASIEEQDEELVEVVVEEKKAHRSFFDEID